MMQHDQLGLLANRLGSERYQSLIARLDAALEGAPEKNGDESVARRMLAASEFFRTLAERQIDWLEKEADFTQPTIDGLLESVTPQDLDEQNEQEVLRSLRVLRQRAMLHIVWRSFTCENGLNETLAAMTTLADFVVKCAVRCAEKLVSKRYGEAIGDDTGAVQRLIVVGMGKLGGRELNLSSDIDIMFIYDEPGTTQGGRSSTSNQEYFTRIAQTVIRLIDSVTVDGRVFRVDTRLRPFGESGALVASYPSLENYYQQHGRDWERYALLKARCITGTAAQIRPFQQLARQFVYRRYTDFGVIDGLRSMKALIDTERVKKGLANDVKRGAGGIREAEFIVQSHQLVRGGRVPSIQKVGFEESVRALASEECLSSEVAQRLHADYRYLRQLEHGIQALRDEQTHELPSNPTDQEALCMLLGFHDWGTLTAAAAVSRSAVASEFEALLTDSRAQKNLILGIDSDAPSLDGSALQALSLRSPATLAATLTAFINETRFRVMDAEARQRLQKVLPLLVKEVDQHPEPGAALDRVLSIVTAILKRSAYLSLLAENPQARERLVSLVARSSSITNKLKDTPELLDELLFPKRLFTVPSREDIREQLDALTTYVDPDDLEAVMQHLRRLKEAITFRVAVSELEGSIPLMKVSDNLSFLAEVIVERAVAVAYRDLVKKYGEPTDGSEFCVLAYGKLGGIELSYESDLDLVFVASAEEGFTAGPKQIDHQRFFTRLAQRVIHILSTNMMGGRLYEIDLRLRPNGDSGLLVTSLSGLKKYLESDAWTWEHQALVRARVIAGGSALVKKVEELRVEVLSQHRDDASLTNDVTSMRHKMRDHQADAGAKSKQIDLKYGRGGIVDIEFVVQYLVLKHAVSHPQISVWSDVVRILDSLEVAGILSKDNANSLRDAYLQLRAATHRIAMSYDTEDDLAQATESMARAWANCAGLLPNL
ncbi:MAG: bifunctional [glutamate--ammonia ligase]-adenylyl-L-tyrosine phosphorylase/[glutamate--ammonia-ligase] adenylyltransferase [Halieaceae bacterium]